MLFFEGDGPDNEVDEPLAWSVAFSSGIRNCVAPAHGSSGVMCGRPCAQVIFGESTDACLEMPCPRNSFGFDAGRREVR